MNAKVIDIEIDEDGTLRAVYDDDLLDLAEDMGARVRSVERLSHVEWETVDGESGWSVRSARDAALAIREVKDEKGNLCYRPAYAGPLVLFCARADALRAERRFAWDLR